MADYSFESGIGTYIQVFIEQKQALGYPYQSSSRILYHFDSMVADKFPDAHTMTKEICHEWLHLKPGEHPNGLLRRVTPVRQLGKYMNGIGVPTYVLPGHIPNRQIRYEAQATEVYEAMRDENQYLRDRIQLLEDVLLFYGIAPPPED